MILADSFTANWPYVVAVLGGMCIPKLFEMFGLRENRLWQQIGKLEAKIESLEASVKSEREVKHAAVTVVNWLNTNRVLLETEVNDLLEELGRAKRYDTRRVLDELKDLRAVLEPASKPVA